MSDRKRTFTFSIQQGLVDRVQAAAKENDETSSRLIRRAILAELAKMESAKSES